MGKNTHSFITQGLTTNICEYFLPAFFYTLISSPTMWSFSSVIFLEGVSTYIKENKYLKGFTRF